jgi:hypothetical protein
MADITYFDLDAVVPDEVVIKLGGKQYALKPVSVDDFIKNSKMLQAIDGAANDLESTLAHTVDLLTRAFPTMSEKVIRGMSMLQMNKLVELAHGMNGQKASETSAAAAATENPPTAG